MAKILYIITQSEWGGAQRNVFDLASGLKDKHEVMVAAGPDGGYELNLRLAKKQIANWRLHHLRRSINPWHDLAGFFEIIKLLKQFKPDVLHLHSSKAGVLGSVAGRLTLWKLKIIYTVHGAVFEAPFNKLLQKFFLYIEKFTSPFKDKIICVSENDKKLWLKYNAAPAQKLAVVHNGIDLSAEYFLAKDEAREHLFGESAPLFEAVKENKNFSKLIGTIANLYPEKGLPYLIEAANILSQNRQDLIFVVIGEGMQRELLEEMIEEHKLQNRFVLAGSILNAGKYLKAFDIFVLPSVKEGLPYTILEAMAADLPIAASYVGGIPEVIENDVNGLLVTPKNSELLADKIKELLDDTPKAQRLGSASLQRVKDFTVEKMVQKTEEVYSI